MDTIKRCFIENDFELDDYDIEYFQQKTGNDVKDIFNIIGNAFENKEKTWNAILAHDEIWLSSSFVGDSGELFSQMLKSAIKAKLKNKTIINIRNFSDVAWHLTEEHREMMRKLYKNKVRFIFKDDYKKYNKILKALEKKV